MRLKILTPEGHLPDIDTSTAISVDQLFPQYQDKRVRKNDVANKKLIMETTRTRDVVLNLGEGRESNAKNETSRNGLVNATKLPNVIRCHWKTLKPPREEQEVLEIECCMRELLAKYKAPTSLVYMPVEIEGVLVPACVRV